MLPGRLVLVLLVTGLLTDGTAVPAVVLLHLTPAGLHHHPAVTVTLTLLPRPAPPPSLSPPVMPGLAGLSVPGGVPQSEPLDVPPELLL